MGRKKLNEENKKDRFSITLNKELSEKVRELKPNTSKYIEWLIYQDLKKNNQIDENFML